jgi:hypothetical protein
VHAPKTVVTIPYAYHELPLSVGPPSALGITPAHHLFYLSVAGTA